MLVGITGPAQNGKDTLATFMLSQLPHVSQYALASKIKEFLYSTMNTKLSMSECKEGTQEFVTTEYWLLEALKSSLKDGLHHYGVSPESAIETMLKVLKETTEDYYVDGHDVIHFKSSWRELMQHIGTDWGREYVNENIWLYWMPKSGHFITDVRRDNEAQAVIDQGGLIIKVIDDRKGAIVKSHVSEEGISKDLIRITVNNNGSLKDLQDVAKSLVQYLNLSKVF